LQEDHELVRAALTGVDRVLGPSQAKRTPRFGAQVVRHRELERLDAIGYLRLARGTELADVPGEPLIVKLLETTGAIGRAATVAATTCKDDERAPYPSQAIHSHLKPPDGRIGETGGTAWYSDARTASTV
jgi:hypothetical protein